MDVLRYLPDGTSYKEVLQWIRESTWEEISLSQWVQMTGSLPPESLKQISCPQACVEQLRMTRLFNQPVKLPFSEAVKICSSEEFVPKEFDIEIEENSFRPGETDIEIEQPFHELLTNAMNRQVKQI